MKNSEKTLYDFQNSEIKDNKLVLTNQQITKIFPVEITEIPKQFQEIKKLYLSYNQIKSLDGINLFTKLQQISIAFNNLLEPEFLLMIDQKENIRQLSIKGNFLDRHPGYKSMLINYFPNLTLLDNLEISQNMRCEIFEIQQIETQIVPFIRYIRDRCENIEKLQKSLQNDIFERKNNEKSNKIDIWVYIKELIKYEEINNLLGFIKNIKNIQELNNILEKNEIKLDKNYTTIENIDILYDSFSALIKSILVNLRLANKQDLERYLSYLVLKNDQILFNSLKHQITKNNNGISLSEPKYYEYCAELLIKNVLPLNYVNILNEQVRHFIRLFCNFNDFDSDFKSHDTSQNKSSLKNKFDLSSTIKNPYILANFSNPDKSIRFPLFPLNFDFQNAFQKSILDTFSSLSELYRKMQQDMIENFPESKPYLSCFYGDFPRNAKNWWEEQKINEKNSQQNTLKKRVLQLFSQRLSEIASDLWKRQGFDNIKSEFIEKLKNIAKNKKKLDNLLEQAIEKVKNRNLKNSLGKLKDYSKNITELNEISENHFNDKIIRKIFAGLKQNANLNKKLDLQAKLRLLHKVLLALQKSTKLHKILSRLLNKQRKKLLAKSFAVFENNLRELHESREKLEKMTLDRTLNKSTLADTNPDVSGIPTFIKTFDEIEPIDENNKETQDQIDIDSFIDSIHKMKEDCMRQLRKKEFIKCSEETHKKKDEKNKICSLKCKTKVPAYLQQKAPKTEIRKILHKSTYPVHSKKTLATVAKMI